ncbi:hypothetical protein ACJO2E_11120 [Marinobacter sp. M1N3S26]|uniref:hypothetical protein n=1 Tax=unclassified Marinobacter TaxID=83889 RepID=UPI00387AF237
MRSINTNLKKTAAIATIVIASFAGASNAAAQQVWMEEVMAQQEQQVHDATTEATAESKSDESVKNSAS